MNTNAYDIVSFVGKVHIAPHDEEGRQPTLCGWKPSAKKWYRRFPMGPGLTDPAFKQFVCMHCMKKLKREGDQ